MLMTDIHQVEELGQVWHEDRQGNIYHPCRRCGTLAAESFHEEHDELCPECWETLHQCESCGEFEEQEIEPARNGMRYCNQCRKDMLKDLLDDMDSIQRTFEAFSIITAKVGNDGSYLHLREADFGQFKEMLDWDTETKPHIDGYTQEAIILNGIEVMCLHKIEAIKEQELKEAV